MAEEFDEPESTRVVVMKMAKSRRRGRLAIWGAVAVVGGLILWWAGVTASHIVSEREEIYKQPEPTKKQEAIAPAPINPEAETAWIYIYLDKPGQVFVDGKKLGKKVLRERVEVLEGDHTLIAVIGRDTMQQTLNVHKGEEFLVHFDAVALKVRLRRLQLLE
jgi:hypothetical protein